MSERGQVDAVLRLAKRLGAAVVTVQAKGVADEVLEIRRLRDYHGMARDLDLVLAVETHRGAWGDPKQVVRVAIDTGIPLTLDPAHLVTAGATPARLAELYPHAALVSRAELTWLEFTVRGLHRVKALANGDAVEVLYCERAVPPGPVHERGRPAAGGGVRLPRPADRGRDALVPQPAHDRAVVGA